MISNAISLHSPKDGSGKLPGDISEANEDLLADEQLPFSTYAMASVNQQQALGTGKPLASLYAGDAKAPASELGQPLVSNMTDLKQLTDKYAKLDLLHTQSKELGLEKPVNANPSNASAANLDITSLVAKADKPPLSVGQQHQTATSSLPAFNPTASAQKSDSSFQATLITNQILQSSTQIADSDPANLVTATANRTQAAVSQWGPVPVTVNAPLMQQAQEMLTPLREQLRFQIDQQIKQAELRLDPPSLGKVELNIRLDGDRLHIQMHAANPSVRDSLLMGLERLREELAMDHGGQISLDIGQGEKQEQRNEEHMAHNIESQIDLIEPERAQHEQHTNQIDLLA